MILFVHGGPGRPAVKPWGLAKLLADKGYCCVFYDMRGCGRSTRPTNPACKPNENPFAGSAMKEVEKEWGFGAQIADIERLRRLFKKDKLIIYGHSFGGLISTMYACEFQDKVSQLVLVSPANLIVMPAKTGDVGDLFKTIRKSLPEDKKPGFEKWYSRMIDFQWQFKATELKLAEFNCELFPYYFELIKDDKYKRQREIMEKEEEAWKADEFMSPELPAQGGYINTALYLGLGAHHNWSAAVSELSLPTLVVHGALDPTVEENHRDFASYIKGCEFAVCSDGGHMTHSECPEQLLDAILPFLKKKE